ncbi:MAG TPA: folylpolyglutamate synthase/dihydrofolate synthase family protein [Geobacteraceae bacterium]
MTYEETLSYLFSRGRFGMRPGLERISATMSRLGDPHQRLTAVQVAGTNGKGSTAAFLSAVLTSGDQRTGLFTSPHLMDFTERFRIDGQEIEPARLTELAGRVIAAAPAEATFFELTTAIGLLWFAEEQVDVAILEVGLGGRYDATSIVDGSLAVITPIALDHTEWLGESVAAIAGEKAGIIRPGRPVVCASQDPAALAVIAGACHDRQAPLYLWGERFSAAWEGDALHYHGLQLELAGLTPGLAGPHQAVNAACALAAAELLAAAGRPLPVQALRDGIAAARWPGRLELFPGAPPVLLDGAHNPAGAQALVAALAGYPRRRLLLVTGLMADKDALGLLTPLLPLADTVYAVTPGLERAMPATQLAELCGTLGKQALAAGRVGDGLSQARREAAADDLVLVCGSLFTVGEARALLTGQSFQPVRG